MARHARATSQSRRPLTDAVLEPITIGPRTAPNRIVFGPHPTNLGRRRAFSDRHSAYYARRAEGGAGIIVFEEASVHVSDWPYERAPLATDASKGWALGAEACHAAAASAGHHSPLLLAAIGHSGGQGSSAYSQAPLWAPSPVPEVSTREVPKEMEPEDIEEVIEGFAQAARLASEAGLDGVEINAGQYSLVRQFLSGLTNQRNDEWGSEPSRFLRRVLEAVNQVLGRPSPHSSGGPLRSHIVGLRLSCDELAPWAGIVPEQGARLASEMSALVDYVAVVRGSIYTTSATRPDGHEEPGFNRELTALVRKALAPEVAVMAQGSIVSAEMAAQLVSSGTCELVEMTRAQIADPDLVRKLADPQTFGTPRPCILCNQWCQVRDNRNPIISCVGEPGSGYEREDRALLVQPARTRANRLRRLLVVGAGPAGLECARAAALCGWEVTVAERSKRTGGMVRTAALGAGRHRLSLLVDWLEAICTHLGVQMALEWDVSPTDVAKAIERGDRVVICTGSVASTPEYAIASGGVVIDAATALASEQALSSGDVLIWDPIGGPIGISVAESFAMRGRSVTLVTPDVVVGQQLSLSGDLAPSNTRLQSAGVRLVRRALLRQVEEGSCTVEDRFSGEISRIEAALVIDAGHRLPDESLWNDASLLVRPFGAALPRAGDCVAPRTIGHAILEARRAVLALGGEP